MVFNNLALQLLPKMLSVNQAETLFDQQYLGEETIDILLFLHRDLQEMSSNAGSTWHCYLSLGEASFIFTRIRL